MEDLNELSSSYEKCPYLATSNNFLSSKNLRGVTESIPVKIAATI